MVRTEAVPSTDPVARRLLDAYVEEITGRMAAGFDPRRAAPPGPDDFEPPNGVFIVAYAGEDDGRAEPMGCGALRTFAQGIGEIRRMYVAPAARGMGAGRAILARLEEEARARGHHTVRLDTSEELAEAQALYERSGYRRIPAYNDNEFAARWYEKQLT